jgi:hypothetical protein
MLQFVIKYRKAIDAITADKSLKMRKYELDNDDWQIINDLVSVLAVRASLYWKFGPPDMNAVFQQYKRATLFFSQDSASVAAIIPAMDKLDNNLNPNTKTTYHPAILAAMKLARRKINRYYSITDASSVYRMAMGALSCSIFITQLIILFSSSSRT